MVTAYKNTGFDVVTDHENTDFDVVTEFKNTGFDVVTSFFWCSNIGQVYKMIKSTDMYHTLDQDEIYLLFLCIIEMNLLIFMIIKRKMK